VNGKVGSGVGKVNGTVGGDGKVGSGEWESWQVNAKVCSGERESW
jgi:hypothetical protein